MLLVNQLTGFGYKSGLGEAAGGGATTPLTIVANAHWYQNKTGVSEATGVDQWDDQGPNNKHLTQATPGNQPAYTSASGKIEFDGVDEFLENTTVAMSGTHVHIWLVAALLTGGDNYGQYVGWESGVTNPAKKPKMFIRNNATTQIALYETAFRGLSVSGVIDGVIKSIHSEVVAGTSSIYVDGVSPASTGTVGTPLAGDGLCIGHPSGTGQLDVYEIVYVTESMTAQQITDMDTYIDGVRDGI